MINLIVPQDEILSTSCVLDNSYSKTITSTELCQDCKELVLSIGTVTVFKIEILQAGNRLLFTYNRVV